MTYNDSLADKDDLIASGLLEMYVLGTTSPQEAALVEHMMVLYEDVRAEIDEISIALEKYGMENAITPDPTIRPFVMAIVDYTERMKKGETPTFPPALQQGSRVSDYSSWLERKDLQLTVELEDAHAFIIGYTPEVMTAIVWLKYGSPPETHTNELEKFLIVEGTCDITIGNEVHKMKAGDTLIIPLYISHHVQVTSDYPCKVILQRAAA